MSNKQENRGGHNRSYLKQKRIGNLLVLREIGRFERHIVWECLCRCGNLTTATSSQLNAGIKTNCSNQCPMFSRPSLRKLTNKQVRDIKRNYQKGVPGHTMRALGRKYNVSDLTIALILKGKTYKDVK